MTVSYGKGAKAKATKLHSRLVRTRGRCEFPGCGNTLTLQCAHIIRRTYSTTRCLPENAWCLCSKHHFFVDNDASEFMALVDCTIGRAEFDRLKTLSLDGVGKKHDWSAEVLRLSALLNQVEAA